MMLIKQTDIDQLLDATTDLYEGCFQYVFPLIEIDVLLDNTDIGKLEVYNKHMPNV